MRCHSLEYLLRKFSEVIIKVSVAASIFGKTPDECICIMKIVLWEASYCRSLNTQTTKAWLRKLLDIQNEGCKCYLGNKEQKAIF